MRYKDALKAADKVGACNAKWPGEMAQTIRTLAAVHSGINPEMVYNGALKAGLTGADLAKLDCVALGDLMFS